MDSKQEELTVLSVRSALDHLKSTVNRAIQRIERQKQSQHAELFAEIKERKKLAKTLELDQRLVDLYQTLVSEPDLDMTPSNVVHCEISEAVVLHEGNDVRLKFKLNDLPYHMVASMRGGGSISYLGETFASQHLSLSCEEGAVLELQLDISGEGSEATITGKQIVSFIPGRWIYDVIHAHETIRASNNLEGIYETYSEESLDLLSQRWGIKRS